MPILPPPTDKQPRQPPTDGREEVKHLKVLHLSDWHYDPHYQVGFEAECPDPICCRPRPSFNKTIIRPAGIFGDYRCDSPLRLSEEVLKQAKLAAGDQLAMVVLSGDLPPHDIWATSKDEVKQVSEQVTEQLTTYFGRQKSFGSNGAPVFMTIGNHENSPPNNFPSTKIPGHETMVGWLYSSLAEQWSRWLSDESTKTLSKYGYYATSQMVPELNIKLISMNTNHAYLLNWWVFVPDADPDHIFMFLINELYHAEVNGVDVFLLGHIPPSSQDVSRFWKKTFGAIVERFRHTIKAQFYGHSHRDEFELYYPKGIVSRSAEPVSVAYIAPSITPVNGLNPSFRIYDLEQRIYHRRFQQPWISNTIVDYETYVMNLPVSNEMGLAVWFEEMSVKRVYNMSDLSPSSWHNLTLRMEEELKAFVPPQPPKLLVQSDAETAGWGKVPPHNTPLIDTYLRRKNRFIDTGHQEDPARVCRSNKCKQKVICKMRGANNLDSQCSAIDLGDVFGLAGDVELALQMSDLEAGSLSQQDLNDSDTVTAMKDLTSCG
jgi:sphingomyelin phosphodiesterase